MENYILEALTISKVFSGVKALQNVSLNVKKSEILGLIGENGAGKSTLLKILNGWYTYGNYEGTLKLNGVEQKLYSPHDAHLKGIGFVPQEIDVLNELTVAENIYVGHLLAEKRIFVNLHSVVVKAGKFLKEINMELDPSAKVRSLSIGQKQLLMIARALSRNPQVLIMDEPTTALTQNEVENLFSIIKLLKESGTSVIFVTHKLEEIMGMTDRVSVLRDGQYISTYSKDEYKENQIISDMVGRKISTLYPERKSSIGEEVLRVEGMTVDHPKIKGRNLITDISFNLRKGEVLGFAGLVGSGRTEILSTLFGSYKLKDGSIFIDNHKVTIKNQKAAMKNGISMVTEDRKFDGLLMQQNIRRNITLSNFSKISSKYLLNTNKEKQVAKAYFTSLNIKAPSDESMVVDLSGGNQQKVVIAKALNSSPRILLLDEPTKGIDVGAKHEIYCLINQLVDEGISIIMVSSELPELLAMCDRVVVMTSGRVAAELNKAELSQERIMKFATSTSN